MGGLKRKIQTDKQIEKKESKSVAFSKRRNGLYSKTAQLCRLSGAQIAILATPTCSKSNVSFYSFGHSSVDSVVSAFLKNQLPRGEDLGFEFWWEDESLANSEDPMELSEAVDSISRMLQNLKVLRSEAMANRDDDVKKKELAVHGTHQNQALNLGLVKNIKEEDQIVAVSDNNNYKDVVHGTHEELGQNQILDFQLTSSACLSPANFEGFIKSSGEHKDQMVEVSDSSNNLDAFIQELDLDSFLDFEMNPEGFMTTSLEMEDVSTNRYPCSGSEDGAVGIFSESNKDGDIHTCDNNNALPGDSYEEVSMDQIFDLETNSKGLSMNPAEMDDVSMMMNKNQNQHLCSNSEAGGAVGFHRDLKQDNLQFCDIFNELVSVVSPR